MSADPLRLDALLESVADGSEVDWDAAEAAADEDQRRIVRNLRLVASIAKVHRSIPDDVPAAPAPPAVLHSAAVGEAIPRWGHLLLLETIGEGSFGEVYRASDPWLNRQVALKLLKPDIAAPGRLMAEAQALARIRHPNVVTVHGADMRDGRVGLWMELVRGRTLAAIVAAEGPFSASEAAVIGQELCRAVAAVHAEGLVHRDIKAQNVMRESGGRLVLMDFGAGHTPLYAAPELTHGGEPTVATDIYALGVLLYYLVVGKYPVTGSSREELRQAHARGERRRLRDMRPDLPLAFIEAVERALEADPTRRFATAGEMEQALTQLNSVTSAQTVGSRARTEGPAPATMPRPALMAAAALLAAAAAATWWYARPITTPGPDTQLIAVMPLLGPAPEHEYFADGMTEALMQELATLRSVRVVSRTSVDLARTTAKALPAIAKTLNANAILEGSVSTAGDRVRVNLRLIHAGNDTPVWVRTFEQPLNNIFALQRDVARSVAEELAVQLSPQTAQPKPVNVAAHDDYLRGRYLLHQERLDAVKQAIMLFESATRKDPRHTLAYAGIGEAYLTLGPGFNAIPRSEAFRRAREAVTQALELDDRVADAHAVLAVIHFEGDWDWAGAEREFKRALSLNPSHEYARERYAMFLAARAQTDGALAQIAEARRVDPLSPLIASSAGGILRYARRYDEAIAQYNQVVARHPDFLSANVGLARTLNAAGHHDEAIARYRNLTARGVNEPFFVLEIAQADAAAGRADAARKAAADLQQRSQKAGMFVPPESYAYVYGRLGELDRAFEWLNEAFRARSSTVLWLAVDARVDPLRGDPRFERYLKELGLKP
jgi:TolB-like protein/Tfp pilus assembly protein PilF/tRNA A-37 threonylcarbamoyl transferase component Bud32